MFALLFVASSQLTCSMSCNCCYTGVVVDAVNGMDKIREAKNLWHQFVSSLVKSHFAIDCVVAVVSREGDRRNRWLRLRTMGPPRC
jgi:hypothetical protein